MRRSASEIIRELEGRIARLEGKTANKNADIKIKYNKYTGSPRIDVRHLTLGGILGDVESDLDAQKYFFEEDLNMGEIESGTSWDVYIDIQYGQVNISCGVDDGTTKYQAGCTFCLWSSLVAAGLQEEDYSSATKKLASMLKSQLSSFSPIINIGKA